MIFEWNLCSIFLFYFFTNVYFLYYYCYTYSEIFFVRNHLPVPEVDPKDYELEISGIGIKTIHLKLDDIKTKFKKHTISSTIQCAGNRRSELNSVSLNNFYFLCFYKLRTFLFFVWILVFRIFFYNLWTFLLKFHIPTIFQHIRNLNRLALANIGKIIVKNVS